jgi:hypothetical protein
LITYSGTPAGTELSTTAAAAAGEGEGEGVGGVTTISVAIVNEMESVTYRNVNFRTGYDSVV